MALIENVVFLIVNTREYADQFSEIFNQKINVEKK